MVASTSGPRRNRRTGGPGPWRRSPLPYGVLPGIAMGSYIQRIVQRDQIEIVLKTLSGLLRDTEDSLNRHDYFESITRGVFDVLGRRLASEQGAEVLLTNRIYEEIDCIIEQVYPLMSDRDEFIRAFLLRFPNKPAHHEAVFTLSDLRQGLERHLEAMERRLNKLDTRLAEAQCIRAALEISWGSYNRAVLARDLERIGCRPHPEWFLDYSYNLSEFDFVKLNNTDILDYFLGDFFDKTRKRLPKKPGAALSNALTDAEKSDWDVFLSNLST